MNRRTFLSSVGVVSLSTGCLRLRTGSQLTEESSAEPTTTTLTTTTSEETETETSQSTTVSQVELTAAWQADSKAIAMIEPYRNSLFIGDFSRTPSAVRVDENGKQMWNASLDSNYIPANTAITDSKIYIGADGRDEVDSGRVYAFSRTEGEKEWTRNTKPDGMHHNIKFLITDSNDVVVGSQDSGHGDDQSPIIRKLDGATGGEIWRNTDVSQTFISGVVEHEGYLYVSTVSSTLFIVDRESGETVKKARLGNGFSKPSLSEEKIFTGSDAITAYDTNQEENVWRREIVSKAKTPVLVFGERVFVGTEAGHVIGLDKRTGDVSWRKRVQSKVRIPLVPWKQKIWVLDDAGTVYAFDPKSGDRRFEMEANDERRHIAATDEVLMVERQAFKVVDES